MEKLANQNEQSSIVLSRHYVRWRMPYDAIKLHQNRRNVEQYMVRHIFVALIKASSQLQGVFLDARIVSLDFKLAVA